MASPGICWSAEQQHRLQEQLTGSWNEDTWVLPLPAPLAAGRRRRAYHLHFRCTSPGLNLELKYALWRQFDSGAWNLHSQRMLTIEAHLAYIVRWLNVVAPQAPSLLERSLEQWERSLHTYLMERGQVRGRVSRRLDKTQQYVEYRGQDERILFVRKVYAVVADAYDTRPDLDKEIWDLRKLGLMPYSTTSNFLLNFTNIHPPWLLDLAKRCIRQNLGLHSYGDAKAKIRAVRAFSEYLTIRHPAVTQPSDLTRAVMLDLPQYVRERGLKRSTCGHLLSQLRTVLETGSHVFAVDGLTKEALILDGDLPKREATLPRDIPESVLFQMRKHLDVLPTTTLRMVVVLLECGLRLGELCALPVDCLFQDDRGMWSLQLYQSKGKREHAIPLVNDRVVAAIQAQQRDVREQYGDDNAWLFPSVRSPRQPYQQALFRTSLNRWAVEQEICGPTGQLWRFEPHQFRHTVAMRLLNEDVPLDTIRRFLGHGSLAMTERYARKQAEMVRAELERAQRRRVTINANLDVVRGDPRADDPDLRLLHHGLRGAVLPIGGCGRLKVMGPCEHLNRCVTCPLWLTSTDDLPKLEEMAARSGTVLTKARQAGNQIVVENMERIMIPLQQRIETLHRLGGEAACTPTEQLHSYREQLVQAEAGAAEARAAGLWLAVKTAEHAIQELKAKITALEWKETDDGTAACTAGTCGSN